MARELNLSTAIKSQIISNKEFSNKLLIDDNTIINIIKPSDFIEKIKYNSATENDIYINLLLYAITRTIFINSTHAFANGDFMSFESQIRSIFANVNANNGILSAISNVLSEFNCSNNIIPFASSINNISAKNNSFINLIAIPIVSDVINAYCVFNSSASLFVSDPIIANALKGEANFNTSLNLYAYLKLILPLNGDILISTDQIYRIPDIYYVWDVYNASPYYDWIKESGTWSKAQLHDNFNCNGVDSSSNYNYSIDHTTGVITLNVTSNGWLWAYVSYLDDDWGVWQKYGKGTTYPSVFFRNESGTRQTSPYNLVKYTSGIDHYEMGVSTGNIVISTNPDAYPINGKQGDLWYVRH